MLTLLAAAVVVVLRQLWRLRRSRPRGIRFLPGHWLLGNLPDFVDAVSKNEHFSMSVAWHRLLGKTFAVNFLLSPWIVVTTSPDNVEHVLKTNFDNYPKGTFLQRVLSELLGKGIFNADGQEWLHQRKITVQMFTAKLFEEHIWVVVRRNARKLRDILEATDSCVPVDVFDLMNRYTLDTIGEIGFGKCIGSLEDPSSPFLQSFDTAQQICFRRLYTPIWPLLRRLGLGSERRTAEHFGRLDAYSRKVVQELHAGMSRDCSKTSGVAWADIEARKSFVGLFLEDARKRGEHLSEDFLRDLVLNFLIAGRDATAQALSWTIYCLCTHPDAEAKARREVIDVCGVRGPVYEDMGRLPYLQAVLSEALRLFPSVPWDIKVAVEDDSFPDGTFVSGGSLVVYNTYAMGRDPAIWGSDAEAFRPERWLEMEKPPGGYHYPVFNAGPRECPGRRLAMVEMKTCLAMVLPQLSFQLAAPAEQITPHSQLTIGMARGLPCFVVRAPDKEDPSSGASTTAASDCATALSEPTSAASTAAASWMRTGSELLVSDLRKLPSSGEDLLAPGELPEYQSEESPAEQESLAEQEQSPRPAEPGARREPEPAEGSRRGRRSRSPWSRSETEDGSCSESAHEAADGGDGAPTRRRSRQRRSGRSRQRESRFWNSVRQPTPERELVD